MLQAIRDRAMGVLGWIVIGLIIITFALFGLGSYLQDKSRLYVAKVNDVEITPRDLQIAEQNQRERMQQMLGDAYNPAMFDNQILKQQALDNLIRRQLILQAAQESGMKISDKFLAAQIEAVPAFQQDGQFNQERYQRLLAQQGLTPAGFEIETRRMLIGEQLTNGLSNTAFVTNGEIDRAFALQAQKRSFDYITVSAETFREKIEPTDDEISAYYEKHTNKFMTPERVKLAYLRLDAEVLGKGIEVSEEAVNDYYQQKKDGLKTQEKRRASHILFQLAADADDAQVEKIRVEAQGVLQQIRDGADFAKLAKEHSDDPGSSAQGGDLNYFATGAMVPEFDKTVFSMKVDEVSELVRTQFGFHIIKLTDIKGSTIPPLEEVRDDLVKELKQNDIDDLYYEQLDLLTDASYENSDNLDVAADTAGLEVKTSDWITAASGADIGQFPKVRAAAFSEDVLEAGNNSEPIEVGQNDAIVLRVMEREAAQPLPLAEVRDKIVTVLEQEQAAQAAKEAGEKLLSQMAEGAVLKTLAEEGGQTLHQAETAGRDAPGHSPELVKKVFGMTRPAAGSSVDEGFSLANGDYSVVRLSAVADADPADMTEAQRTQMRRGFENMRRGLALFNMVTALRGQSNIEIPEDNDDQL